MRNFLKLDLVINFILNMYNQFFEVMIERFTKMGTFLCHRCYQVAYISIKVFDDGGDSKHKKLH